MDPRSFYLLDPDPQSEKLLDPDPHTMNADPQPWARLHDLFYIVREGRCKSSLQRN